MGVAFFLRNKAKTTTSFILANYTKLCSIFGYTLFIASLFDKSSPCLKDICGRPAPGTKPLRDVLLQNLVDVATKYFIKNSEGTAGVSLVREDVTYELYDLFSARYGGEASTARFAVFR